ncbi:tRNA-uridine aminocarboxypropyltransferase 1 [Amyelois transitella]|uniref:tRNA-uridine aminocarboxypropyltransferase 1 n=1 Tax=Amyelois transitella TaxID=680683 RepID=UPI00298F42D1|nr:tRNA-uridine aminocarboxypropyltransferase 1 [Amyelois transitella]XP_013193044.2 tRNA-uridine aminocarboxypropyltransferase 1 [Amyelois transitella]
MNPKSEEARTRDDRPFIGMTIADAANLSALEGRSSCPKCGKSRMYFCYTCYVPVEQIKEYIPKCSLPVKVDIIKHRREIDGKSTAAHAAVLAPLDVNIYIYPDFPKYELNDRTVLLYPGVDASSVQHLFTGRKNSVSYSEHLLAELPPGYNVGTLMKKTVDSPSTFEIHHVNELPIDRVVLIDSTWNQSRGIFADERLQNMPKIVLQNRASQFWRHQRGSPRWYLSTIEALHQLMLELHISAWGLSEQYSSELTRHYPVHKSGEVHSHCKPYSGEYDNLLYFFKFMYEKLHTLYKHEDMLAYKRPML